MHERAEQASPSDEPATQATACRVCGEACPAASAPFCSSRCRLGDLNKWFRGDYKITREMKPEDLDELE